MKTLAIALLLLVISQIQQTAQTAQPDNGNLQVSSETWKSDSQKWKIQFKVKASDNCMYLDGTGNLYYTYWGNSCPGGRQFTIQWYGNLPPRNITYRTNNRPYVRTVGRQDLNGALISEGPPSTGLGPHTNAVRIEERNLGNQTLLSLVNGEQQPIWVDGYISVRQNGVEVIKCTLGILVESLARERACVYFPGQTYISVLNAEKDPR